MTGSRDFKRLVRKRMAETGESYTVALSHFDAPPKKAAGKTASAPTTVAAFKKQVFERSRTKELAAHLEARYGVRVSQTTKLDVGVFRVDLSGEPSWVARIFAGARSVDAVNGDAEILGYLEQAMFPAERLAHDEPVSMLGPQPVLVTEYVSGTNRRHDASEETMHSLGTMLGRLHALPEGGPGACARNAGSWHHLSVEGGSRRSHVETLLMLFRDAETRLSADERPLLDELRYELEQSDDLDDLPQALIHPDPCGANLIAVDADDGVLVDWTGAGRGSRLGAFANLVGSVPTLALVDAAVAGYRRHVSLEDRELDRLERTIPDFWLAIDSFSFLFQGVPLAMVMQHLTINRQRATAIAERARSAFAAPRTLEVEDREQQATLF